MLTLKDCIDLCDLTEDEIQYVVDSLKKTLAELEKTVTVEQPA